MIQVEKYVTISNQLFPNRIRCPLKHKQHLKIAFLKPLKEAVWNECCEFQRSSAVLCTPHSTFSVTLKIKQCRKSRSEQYRIFEIWSLSRENLIREGTLFSVKNLQKLLQKSWDSTLQLFRFIWVRNLEHLVQCSRVIFASGS